LLPGIVTQPQPLLRASCLRTFFRHGRGHTADVTFA